MQIYISKNNQQLGPFDETKVLEMLKNGEFSANDAAIRQGENEWRSVGHYFPDSPTIPNSANVSPVKSVIETPAPRKSRKGLLLGCGGVMLIGFIIAAVLGLMVYRNMRPADSTEMLPDSIKTETSGEFKLKSRNPPHGNFWGTEQEFVGLYENAAKKSLIIYIATAYADEEAAKTALKSGLYQSCKLDKEIMNFKFLLENGNSLSEGETCGMPLYIRRGKQVYILGGDAKIPEIVEAAENLPFNVGTRMTADKQK